MHTQMKLCFVPAFLFFCMFFFVTFCVHTLIKKNTKKKNNKKKVIFGDVPKEELQNSWESGDGILLWLH